MKMKIENEEAILQLGRSLTDITMHIVGDASRHMEGHGVTHEMVLAMGEPLIQTRNDLVAICPLGDIVYVNMLVNVCAAIMIKNAQDNGIARSDSVAVLTSVFLSHLAKFNDEFDNNILKATEVQGHA
jgi:hypothetical protein